MQVSNAIARACAAAVLAAILPMGCSPSTAGPESVAQASIGQVGQIFHVYQKREKSPPQGLKDLQSRQNVFPAAVASINSKEVLVGPRSSGPERQRGSARDSSVRRPSCRHSWWLCLKSTRGPGCSWRREL